MNESERARSLLTDEFFTNVVEKQRSSYIYNILNSQPNELEVRENAYIKIRALDEFVATLESLAIQPEVEKKRWKIF